MSDKSTANSYRPEIEDINDSTISIRDKYIRLKKILERICKEITSGESLQFSSLFSRLVFITQKFKLAPSLEWQLQTIRVKSSFLLKDKNNLVSQAQYKKAIESIYIFISIIYADRGEVGQGLSPHENEAETYPQKSTLPTNYIRIQVIDIDYENEIIIGKSKTDTDSTVGIRYNVNKINDAFSETISRLWIGAQLNILDSRIDDAGYLIPKYIVLEPDYLIDASAMAECFQNYGKSHLHYFRKKFEHTGNSQHILLGNLANFFLDELIFANDPYLLSFDETFKEAFCQKPFEFTSCNDIKQATDFRAFMVKAKTQFNNIKRVITHDFPRNGIRPDKCSLEPSFFCERFGFQGRLDLLQLADKNNTTNNIIELKSGGLPFPKNDLGKIAINHEVQTTIYRLIIQSVFGADVRNLSSAILYSAAENSGENVRFAAPYQTLEKEIINLRNLIVATEHDLYLGENNAPERLFMAIFNLDNYGRTPDFFTKQIADFEKVFLNISTLEKAYFQRYITFISRELYIQKVGDDNVDSTSSTASLWNTEFAERQETFDLISDLEIIEIDDSGRDMKILFRRLSPSDFVNFREGEICILYPRDKDLGSPLTNQILKGAIASISHNEILLRFRYKQKNKDFFDKYSSWVIEHDKLDHSVNNMYKSLFSFLTSPIDKRQLLLGINKPESAEYQIIKDESEIIEKQNTIVTKAIAANDYFLIVGPPGTGKTSIFARRLIEHYYSNTQDNILIIAYTNRAVDELCESINQAFDCNNRNCDEYIRIGTELSCGENFRHRLLQNIASEAKSREDLRKIIGEKRIFVGTLAAIISRPEIFDIKKFHLSIIDEASQILEPQIIGLLPKVDKFIMIGDHKQLSTITLQAKDKSAISETQLNIIKLHDCSESLFERLYKVCQEKGWEHAYDTLIYQGRMHQELSAFPNKLFYNGILKTVYEWQTEYLDRKISNPSNFYQQLAAEKRLGFIDIQSKNIQQISDKVNYEEAEIVASLSQAILEVYEKSDLEFDPEKTLGIITPYRNQIALIKHKLFETGFAEFQNVMVDTVERFQGSQRDIIILSFCMNKLYQLDFFCNLNNEKTVDRKLNVALTRARQQLFVVGNSYILKQNPIYRQLLESLS